MSNYTHNYKATVHGYTVALPTSKPYTPTNIQYFSGSTGCAGIQGQTGAQGSIGSPGQIKYKTKYRVVEKFTWFPYRIKNRYKWLTKCYILQRQRRYDTSKMWLNVIFISKIQYLKWRLMND